MRTVLAALLAALILAGCGDNQPDPEAEAINHIQDIGADVDLQAIRALCNPDTQAAPPADYQQARDDALTAVHDLIRNNRPELEQAADLLDGCDSELHEIAQDAD